MSQESPLAIKIKKIILALFLLAFLTVVLFYGIYDSTVQSGCLVTVAPVWTAFSIFCLRLVTQKQSWLIGIISVAWWFLSLAIFVIVCLVIAGKLGQLPSWVGMPTTWVALGIGGVVAFLYCLKDRDKGKLFVEQTSKPGDHS